MNSKRNPSNTTAVEETKGTDSEVKMDVIDIIGTLGICLFVYS